jgi:hypothetical protein
MQLVLRDGSSTMLNMLFQVGMLERRFHTLWPSGGPTKNNKLPKVRGSDELSIQAFGIALYVCVCPCFNP